MQEPEDFLNFFYHEIQRSFCDRLVNLSDREKVKGIISDTLITHEINLDLA